MSSESEVPLTAVLLTPGQQLKQARIAKGITLAHISERTLILTSRLEALENDDYSTAGSASTYVVGYVKLYAALVGVDPKPFVKIIDAHFQQTRLEKKLESYVIIKPASRIPWLSIAAAILALVIFMGLGRWFFSQESKPVLTIESSVNELPIPSFESRALINSTSEVAVLPDSFVTDIDIGDRQYMTDSSETPVSETKSPVQVENSASEIILADKPTEESGLDAVIPDAGKDQLTVRFSDDCWLEIFDATHKKLISRLVASGQVISLMGSAPFDVKVGNAGAVSLSVNGRAVALNPSEGQRVLRLQVGP